jgi:putative addiction module component (TIGR02574 family)
MNANRRVRITGPCPFVAYSRDEGDCMSNLQNEIPALTDEQRAELDHRLAKYERNPSDVIPWEQVKAGLFKK